MATHNLKCWMPYFQHVRQEFKGFEVRRNDRDFKRGDELVLQEWDQILHQYTGRFETRRVLYVLEGGAFGIEAGFCVLGLATIDPATSPTRMTESTAPASEEPEATS